MTLIGLLIVMVVAAVLAVLFNESVEASRRMRK